MAVLLTSCTGTFRSCLRAGLIRYPRICALYILVKLTIVFLDGTAILTQLTELCDKINRVWCITQMFLPMQCGSLPKSLQCWYGSLHWRMLSPRVWYPEYGKYGGYHIQNPWTADQVWCDTPDVNLEPPLARWQHCTYNKHRDSCHRGSLTWDTKPCVCDITTLVPTPTDSFPCLCTKSRAKTTEL